MRYLIISLLLIAAPLYAASVRLQWDANTESDLAGYKVYWAAESPAQPFLNVSTVGNVITCEIPNLDVSKTYWFAVTAFSNHSSNILESTYSNIVDVGRTKTKIAGQWNGFKSPKVKAGVDFVNWSTAKVMTPTGWQRIEARRR